MQNYINHLITDIAAAETADQYNQPLAESTGIGRHIEEEEEDPFITLGQHCRLTTEQFPDKKMLTGGQCVP